MARAANIDWTTGADNGVRDSLSYGMLTITAWSNLSDDTSINPLYPSAGGAGYIFWGDLENLGDDNDPGTLNTVGLGVKDKEWKEAKTDKDGNLVPAHWEAKGSKGISGDGGDQDEALIFSFASPFTAASSVKLTLIGLNPDTDDKENKDNSDTLDLYLDFIPTGFGGGDRTIIPVNISGILNAPSVLDFSELGLPGGAEFGSFAVRAGTGHFGVAGIEYTPNEGSVPDPVPEPATMLLLGTGLIGLASFRKRFKR